MVWSPIQPKRKQDNRKNSKDRSFRWQGSGEGWKKFEKGGLGNIGGLYKIGGDYNGPNLGPKMTNSCNLWSAPNIFLAFFTKKTIADFSKKNLNFHSEGEKSTQRLYC